MEITAEIDRVDRTGLLDLRTNPHKRWAIFVRGSRPASAKFKFVFETQQEAIEVAQQYASNRVANGYTDFIFYVVEIKNMIGIEHGAIVNT